MSGFNLKQAFVREKPRSSVTDWIEIMTSAQTAEESYEGMPELVDAINLQNSGPQEVVRALRKKMKHGDAHQQYRAIVIMRLLLDNIPDKMKNALSDHQFLEVLRGIWNDPHIDKRVKKRLNLVLLAWQEQYKDDPSMAVYGGMLAHFKKDKKLIADEELMAYLGHPVEDQKKHRPSREQQEVRERRGEGRRRRSFNFEKDKAKVMNSIVEASQASSNLINAIRLVNLETETLQSNENVQDWLVKAQAAKKVIARYARLVENEELIGTLIETHERLESVLDTYGDLTATSDAAITSGLAKATITDEDLSQMQAGHDAAAERARELDESEKAKEHSNNPYAAFIHPDLADLELGATSKDLPPPLKPITFSDDGAGKEEPGNRGTLSDFSDYESEEEETRAGPSQRRDLVTVSDNSDDNVGHRSNVPPPTSRGSKNPFADPFA